MKNLITKALLIQFMLGAIYAIHGKIVFYDGTYVVGKVTKVDEATVYIIPIGLDTAEGVLVGNVDSLKMENGMVPVVNSAVKYFYQNGEFMANDDDWMDEYDDFQYDNFAMLTEEYKYEGSKRTHQQYYQISVFGGIPVLAATSLQEENGTFKMTPSFGASLQMPYFQMGALDISPGIRAMNFTFEVSTQGFVQAVQLNPYATFDFKPIFYFFPDNIHISADAGISLNVAYDMDQDINFYPGVETGELTGNDVYSGVGFSAGGSVDYWMSNMPLAFRLFFNNYIVPQAPPFTDQFTMFSSIGVSLVVVLKRHTQNNILK